MSSVFRHICPAFALIICFLLLAGCDRQEKTNTHFHTEGRYFGLEYGTVKLKLPPFELLSAKHDTPRNSTDFEGKVLLITFFAGWCGTCREEIDGLKSLQEQFRGEDFSVIAVSVDRKDPASLLKLIEKGEFNYPVLRDDGRFSEALGGISTVSTAFLVDRAGYVRKKYSSHLDQRVLAEEIQQFLFPAPES